MVCNKLQIHNVSSDFIPHREMTTGKTRVITELIFSCKDFILIILTMWYLNVTLRETECTDLKKLHYNLIN